MASGQRAGLVLLDREGLDRGGDRRLAVAAAAGDTGGPYLRDELVEAGRDRAEDRVAACRVIRERRVRQDDEELAAVAVGVVAAARHRDRGGGVDAAGCGVLDGSEA